MTNLGIILISFFVGFYFHKYKEKLFMIIKQVVFFIKNYRAIKKSKYYNEFLEDYISSQDFERGDDIG